MKIVDIGSYCDSEMSYLIIPEKTGIKWSNQVGGHACAHPEIEGILIPVRLRMRDVEDIFENIWGDWNGSRGYPFYLICFKEFMKRQEWETFNWFSPVEEKDFDPKSWGEAWIPLILNSTIYEAWNHFEGQKAILTYTNSD